MSTNTEAVHAHLKQVLAPLGLDPNGVYVTEVADVVELKVVASRSLVEESLYWLKRGQEPTYDQGLVGLFHRSNSFDAAHRVGNWRLRELEKAIGEMLTLA
ncbi:hypothetical protein ACLPJF_04965 [Pseudomonas vlassakiae]|uniref:hypothetical protein n=1 Tax=Pseudomonas TaxID=286 RepID=UPI000E332879|nr:MULTISPECIES: hypothetical protein [unclassified Pseudomonas]AXQ49688.1 hypothetical protein DZC31_23450 [Stenotrophomonas rhizophila]